MYVVLVAAIVAGLGHHGGQRHRAGHEDAQLPRDGVAVVPVAVRPPARHRRDGRGTLAFQLHTLVGMPLFTIWPFTRLVHAFTAPLHYLFRPYIVYRCRDARPTPAPPGSRGWAAGRHPDRDT